MTVRKLIALLVSCPVLLGVVPSMASAQCVIAATGAPGLSGGCRYIAAGPGTYSVAGISGFRIMRSPNGGATWTTLVARGASDGDPSGGISAATGDLATLPGDLVDVAVGIGQQTVHSPAGDVPWRYQDGFLVAGDK